VPRGVYAATATAAIAMSRTRAADTTPSLFLSQPPECHMSKSTKDGISNMPCTCMNTERARNRVTAGSMRRLPGPIESRAFITYIEPKKMRGV